MSHFTVMVKVPNQLIEELGLEGAIAQQLAPYQENNMGDCPEEFLAFNDVEEECREQYEEEEAEFILTPDGELTWPSDQRYQQPVEDSPYPRTMQVIPEDHQRVTRPLSDMYPTFEQFLEDYAGYKEKDPKTGKYGYWENPNAKWDWYQIGGRWQGSLLLKEEGVLEGVAQRGEPSPLAGLNPKSVAEAKRRLNDPHTADVARFKDIDFEGMEADIDSKIHKFYEDVEKIRELEAAGKELNGDLIFGARFTAIELGLVNQDAEGNFTTMKPTFTLDDLLTGYRYGWRWTSFAVIDEEGEWHEKASMGWFGCHDGDEDDIRAWRKFFKRDHIDNTDPDTWIVMVDCHI